MLKWETTYRLEGDSAVERLTDSPYADYLISCAPHGGAIETHTDDQARVLADAVGPATCWEFRGTGSNVFKK